MNMKLMILAAAFSAALCAQAAKELVDGYTWEYTVANGEATVTGVEPASGRLVVPVVLGGVPVKRLSGYAMDHRSFSSIVIPEGVTTIDGYAMFACRTGVTIPSTVTYIGPHGASFNTITRWTVNPTATWDTGFAFSNSTVLEAIFVGDLPQQASAIPVAAFRCKRQYAQRAIKLFGAAKFAGYIDDAPEVEIVSAGVRAQEPTVMDVVYKVYSDKPTVKVRAVAFQDGERSLSKVVPVTKLIEGTETNIGDAISAGTEHKLTWQVSGDWDTDLSKVKFEVLAVEDDILPLELQTIPPTATHAKMKISWNQMTADKVFDALLWLYADKDAGLVLTNGQLKHGGDLLASGTGLYNTQAAVAYVFGKMGYQVLSGDELTYARRVTQLDLPVGGVQQFAVRYPED